MLRAMKPPLFVRAVSEAERAALQAGLRSSDAFVLRRCQTLLASARGETARRIGEALGCSDQAVRDAIRAFNAAGLTALARRSSRPHTVRPAFDAAASERLRELVHRSPREFGQPSSVWTLPLLARVSAAEGLTAGPVTGETVRATLVRLGVRWQRAKQWVCSPDPAYTPKNDVAIG